MSIERQYEPDAGSKVSVIIPMYNRSQLIEEAIQSLQAQTHTNFEVIIVDDGSTDGSYELAQKLAGHDQRIKVLQRSRKPKGAPTCRNIGIEVASGKYIIFLDSDDLLAPFCLERRVARMQQFPQLDFAVFNMLLFNKKPGDLNLVWNVATEENDLERFLRIDGVWSITGPIYKKEFLVEIGGFTEGLPFWQDFELHTRALCYEISYTKFFEQGPDSYNRRHDFDSISQKGFHGEMKLVQKIKIYESIVELLLKKRKLNAKIKKAIGTAYFSFSIKWITDYQNLKQALHTWYRIRPINVIGWLSWLAGCFALTFKYLQIKLTPASLIFSLLYKVIFFLFLMKFKHQEPNR